MDINEILQSIDVRIVIFILLQFVNVITSTVKSILTVNGTKFSASIANAVSYTVGCVVTKLITEQSFEMIVIVSIISNLIGTYIGMAICDYFKPVSLYTMTATSRGVHKAEIEEELLKRSIQYNLIHGENDRWIFTVFCYSKGESRIAEEIMTKYKRDYTVAVNRKWRSHLAYSDGTDKKKEK